LTVALKKNGKLFNEESESKSFHSIILTLLGKCYLEIGSFEDSLELLKKAYEIQTQMYGDDSENSVQTLTLIANCQTKMKDYEAALESIIKVYNISEAKYGYKSEYTAFTFIETAKIHACQEDW
jgi:tetratricopeptide (TPR) repeat protein